MTVHGWLEAYKKAWEERDPDAAAALFAEDAPYREQPYEEPFAEVPLAGEFMLRFDEPGRWTATLCSSPARGAGDGRLMIAVGDADGTPPSHAVEFFGLFGGGRRDAGRDRSGMTHHRLAICLAHFDIDASPALSAAVTPFLDGA